MTIVVKAGTMDGRAEAVDHERLLNALPSGVVQFTADGTLRYGNDVAATMLGGPTAMRSALKGTVAARPTVLEIAGRRVAFSWAPYGDGSVALLRDATGEAEAIERAQDEARRDALTNLPNRKAFGEAADDALGDARALGTELALLMLDLDGFKPVNDAFGHGVGDVLLRTVAKRLCSALRDDDTVYRLGGDEFALLLPCTDPAFGDARHVGEAAAGRIVELISRAFLVEGQMVTVGASVGIATWDGASEASELLRRADIALYQAKSDGRGRFVTFREGMDTEMKERRDLEIALRRAVTLEKFELHYQPQFDLARGLITSFEALVRWPTEDGKLMPPNEFIPLAEETGLIVPLGEWVLHEACREAAGWNHPVSVSVNVSGVQFGADLLNTVREALAAAGLPAERLVIEITESVLINAADAAETIVALRELGVRIAMDDFGTGTSSLSYLREHPFDIVKVDQSFVRGEGDGARRSAIVRAVTQLAESVGMTVTAEGVETVEQLDSIRADGCGSIQGYLVGRPVPAQALNGMLASASEAFAGEPRGAEKVSRTAKDAMTPAVNRVGEAAPAPYAANDVDEPVVDTGPVHRLVYRSVAVLSGDANRDRHEVRRILATAQRHNTRNGVTGALLFNGQHFAQVLEGPQTAVEETFERIQQDPRHGDVVLLSFAPAEHRLFSSWKMAHVGPATARFAELSGLTGIERNALRGDQIADRLHDILVRSAMVA